MSIRSPCGWVSTSEGHWQMETVCILNAGDACHAPHIFWSITLCRGAGALHGTARHGTARVVGDKFDLREVLPFCTHSLYMLKCCKPVFIRRFHLQDQHTGWTDMPRCIRVALPDVAKLTYPPQPSVPRSESSSSLHRQSDHCISSCPGAQQGTPVR